MKSPDFDLDDSSEDRELSRSADDVIQQLYSEARELIYNELDVDVKCPTRHDVVFTLDDEEVAIDLMYAHTGEERFRLTDRDMQNEEVSEEEFRENVDDEVLWKLKKAIEIYRHIALAQLENVSQEVVEERYI